MKFFYSLIFFSPLAFGNSPYIQVSYERKDIEYAEKIQKILELKFQLPKSIYLMKEVEKNCSSTDKVKALHLCISKNDFRVIYRNERIITETLGVFWQ